MGLSRTCEPPCGGGKFDHPDARICTANRNVLSVGVGPWLCVDRASSNKRRTSGEGGGAVVGARGLFFLYLNFYPATVLLLRTRHGWLVKL